METGTDGRFYDWHYDYNHNGMLEMNELMDYEDTTFGSDDSGYSVRGRSFSTSDNGWDALGRLVCGILGPCLIIGGFFVCVLAPPVGAFIMFIGYWMKDKV